MWKILILFFLSVQISYAENFTGKWIGEGSVELPTGKIKKCAQVELVISHNVQANWTGLWVMSGFNQCGLPTHFQNSSMFEIKENKIYYNQEVVGVANENEFTILVKADNFKEYIRFEIVDKKTANFSRYLTHAVSLDAYNIDAKLTKK